MILSTCDAAYIPEHCLGGRGGDVVVREAGLLGCSAGITFTAQPGRCPPKCIVPESADRS